MGLGEIGVESRNLGTDSRCPAAQLNRSGKVAVLVVEDAEPVQGVGVVAFFRQ